MASYVPLGIYNGGMWASNAEFAHLERLALRAHRLVDGLFAGRHGSWHMEAGHDFYDFRAYTPGDPLSQVDWKLLGRTDRPYVRRQRRQTDLTVQVAVDASASMDFADPPSAGQPQVTKWHTARLLAAGLALVAIRQGDRAGLTLLDGIANPSLAPAGTPAHWQRMVALLQQAKLSPQPRAMGDLLAGAVTPGRRGMIVLISDLLDEPAATLTRLGQIRQQGLQVMVFQVLTRAELTLKGLGADPLRLLDPEAGSEGASPGIDIDVQQVREIYCRRMAEHLQTLQQGCLTVGAAYHLFRTDESPIAALARYLRWKSIVGDVR